ncbi:hypothetical protein [Halorubrum kocurii]|uniref:Uncharacterized protein n=1 Tax=Halorubrum kocurii JCM 14978 TaxID=1230456 RepID=M0NQN3_9EURY|nr:hypothetical protein [Halorubrum kocurii]EMA59928.1 hypothetical protein C468_14088 [Halorubrum kocurii JCM 14978]
MDTYPGGGGGGSDDGSDGGSDDGSDDGGGGVFAGLTRSRILGILGISTGLWASLTDFGERLAEADSLRDLVVEIVLTELVSAFLSFFEYLFAEVLYAVEVVSRSFWVSIVAPFGELYDSFTEPIIGSLETLRTTVESAVASTGIAAPFVALTGWVAVLLVVAAIVGVLWSLAETYLPTEAVTANASRLYDLARSPFEVLRRLVGGAARVVRGDTEGPDES